MSLALRATPRLRVVEIGPGDAYPHARSQAMAFEPALVARDRADRHLVVIDDDRCAVARCSLWWSHVPRDPRGRVGAIGHYAADDREAAALLLEAACDDLRDHGATLAVGPMDGSTWRAYRLVTERGHRPPFFLEPENPDDWPRHFAAAGFRTLETYVSTFQGDLAFEDPRLAFAEARCLAAGVTIRSLDMGNFDDELARFHEVTHTAFARNPFFVPVDLDAFHAQHAPLRPLVDPRVTVVAERDGDPVGYLFAMPDHAGAAADTIVLKTVATVPDRRLAGLGILMTDHVYRLARAAGYRHGIHALMRDGTASTSTSMRTSTVMRRYTLYGRRLG